MMYNYFRKTPATKANVYTYKSTTGIILKSSLKLRHGGS